MISLDAVDDKDVDFLLTLPNFSALCNCGTLVREVDSVFVSNTYPAHTSIITGMYPQKHGVIENVLTQPGKSSPSWRCDRHSIKVPTLYDQAAQVGRSVCSILYPVTCRSGIRWNFPEIPGEKNAIKLILKMLRGGSPGFILSSLWQNRSHLKGMMEPGLDDFSTQVAINSTIRKKPDLLLLHLIDVDDQKHRFGPESEQAKEALRRHDKRLGLLYDTLRKIYLDKENFAIIVFSDHGCLPVHTAVEPNDFLKRYGLIREPTHKAGDYDAFFHNAGGTTFLKILQPDKTEDIMHMVSDIMREPFVKRKLTEEEMSTSGMNSEYFCGIEAAEGFCFGELHAGQHGYSLKQENYHAFYLAASSKIECNKIIKGGSIVDICPLAADLLEIPCWEMDGRNRLTGK